MHSALEIDEILYNIFGHCLPQEESTADLAALARTCRTFKDPALDVLWEHLEDMSPLARCLPDASCRLGASPKEHYSFHRPLTQNEWDILRSYTRRIRFMQTYGLDKKSLGYLCNPPTPELLFSNVRWLRVKYVDSIVDIFSVPFPCLTTLYVPLPSLCAFNHSIKSFAKTSTSLRKLTISTPFGVVNTDLSFVCQWRNLQSVDCGGIFLDAVTLVHLSHTAALTELCFTVSRSLPDQISLADSLLSFPNLRKFEVHSESMDQISQLLSKTRLPTVKSFSAHITSCPSRLELASFVDIQRSCIGPTIQRLVLFQVYDANRTHVSDDRPVLSFEHLRPWSVFTHICDVKLTLEWRVDLTDRELLTLVSAWPSLWTLEIKGRWGWKNPFGITPNGLVQLLQTCPSLMQIALAIDTRGDIPSSPPCVRATKPLLMDVLDSFIEAETVPTIAAFFAAITGPRACCAFVRSTWHSRWWARQRVGGVYWNEVKERVEDIVEHRRSNWQNEILSRSHGL